MDSNRRFDAPIAIVFAGVAALAILAALVRAPVPIRFVFVFGGVVLGPGALACRLVTSRHWAECLAIGVTLNAAAVMVVSMLLVSVHFWHPVPVELLIPATTLPLAALLLRGAPTRSNPA